MTEQNLKELLEESVKLSEENECLERKLNFLSAEEIGKLFPIRIVPYDYNWKNLFEQEKLLIINTLDKNMVVNIEHIGSTSVVGLAAKPTIDILVELSNLNEENKQIIIQKLGTIAYGNMSNSEQEKKMVFGKGYDENYGRTQTYHVHIREKADTVQDEIYFRDYLIQNSAVRDEYAKLKYALAEKYQFNRENYTESKTEFITKIIKQK